MKKSLYIFSPGELKRKDNTLFFQKTENDKPIYRPIENINEIMIFGEVSFNKSLLELLSRKEILVHYFNYYGYYMGTFYPREHLNSGYMIIKQVEHYATEKRLVLAKAFVQGACKNIRQVLKYYHNRGRDLAGIINNIEILGGKIDNCLDVSQLMALEGNIREYYYRSFDEITQDKDFIFVERTRRPPENRINALISFGNSLLYSLVLSEIYKTHLDPRIGFLHTSNFRRFSLNLDIAEIFKPIIVDRLIFSLIDRRMITKKDFAKETGGIFLKEKGRKLFVQEMDEKLKNTIKHRQLGRSVSYRRLIRMEAYKLEKHIIGEQSYEPFIARW